MRKVVFQMLTSLDGFFEGPAGEIDWHNVDKEFNSYAIDLLDNADVLLFGRKTYELMANFWPTPEALKDDPEVAKRMNALPKIVFSRTLDRAAWANTRLVSEGIVEEILKLKTQPGKNLLILASSDLACFFIEHDLIDELQIIVNPIVLGDGKTLFRGLGRRFKLRLLKAVPFQSGNVVLHYAPADEIVIRRVFDAPRERVWKAFTEPGFLTRWWGPKTFTTPVFRNDLRTGGRYHFCMRSPDGKDVWGTGVYREIHEFERLVYTDSFADEKGNVVPASHYDMSDDIPMEMLVTMTFEDVDGGTAFTLRHAGLPAGELAELTRTGWAESFDKLAAILKKT